jgi:hypothetical protein
MIMLQNSYEIWGVAIVVILMGIWAIRHMIRRENKFYVDGRTVPDATVLNTDHSMEHRVLIFLMAQQTESILAALARTIDEERQKLGRVVRKPTISRAMVDDHAEKSHGSERRDSAPYEHILPMARKGISSPMIARQLQLPESEISLFLRLHAA